MKRMTRVSFSADGRSVNVNLPLKWADLTQKELIAYFKTVSLRAHTPLSIDYKFALFSICSGARCEHVDMKKNMVRWKNSVNLPPG